MTDKDFEFITDKIGIWFANLKLKSFRHTFDGDTYPSSALVTDYELFIAKLKQDIEFIPEEPVSEELEEASKNHAVERFRTTRDEFLAEKCKWSFKAGAQWQKEQFEKNRLAACDRQTEEEAEIERDFVMGIIEKEHRQPAFDDAIKYGMERMKQQMMAKAIDVEVKVDAGGYPCVPQLELYDYDKDIPLANEGDKYKVVLIKEG